MIRRTTLRREIEQRLAGGPMQANALAKAIFNDLKHDMGWDAFCARLAEVCGEMDDELEQFGDPVSIRLLTPEPGSGIEDVRSTD